MTKIALLLTAVAAGNSAMAQGKRERPASEPYTLTATPATGSGITYQWFRDGQPIAGATSQDYILPGYLAYGTDVKFERGAISSSCPGTVIYTNEVRVAFGLKVGSVYWASANVGLYQTFAARPDMYTEFYQFNRPTAWAATGSVGGWTSIINENLNWQVGNDPCPAGWRLPTQAECVALYSTGTTWANANTRGNAIGGRFIGPNSITCSLPNNMFGCIFLPALGLRDITNGSRSGEITNGYYWSVMQYSNTNGYLMTFADWDTNPSNNANKAYGFPVRCVR